MREVVSRIAILSMVFLVATSGCEIGGNMGETEELESVEVREYEGEKLSSVDSFEENSIKGPRHIDIENYQLTVGGLVEKVMNYT